MKNAGMGGQGYNSRMDESLGSRNGKKSQSMKSRRNESKGMSKAMGKRSFSAVKSMDYQPLSSWKTHKHLS
tara:strand:- start:934 stop:1146 length:213 start_codon:yes stop_codon:yes gene_type:complete